MIGRLFPLVAALLLFPVSAFAQTGPAPAGVPQSRVRTIVYNPDQIVSLSVVPNYQLMVGFDRTEQIDTIALGNNNGWAVQANKRGDFLFVKLGQGARQTNMTVVTNLRVYQFLLEPQSNQGEPAVFAVNFVYLNSNPDGTGSAPRYRFRLRGDRSIRPASIVNDGQRTYLRWPDKVPLPALYRYDDDAGESLANGTIEGNAMVITGVPQKLVFRYGKKKAEAIREPVETSR